ncbi:MULTISPECIES: DMT family transporter [Hyphomicrobiales]|jgi:drug/metabolite transporter (DMT)-like permease|uniref:DMT family transporter n=1 Tax=Hyphomicrobiales TaxID=356 RepID=UPI000363301F|nr:MULTISPECIES: DMT family transporter [Phyllobacteriaceae]MCX8567793.1 DMT family transporter [Aminobacter sp. MET-1]
MQNRTLVGILCLCLGVLVFSIQDALIKAVAGTYPVGEALFIRAIVALPILLVIVHRDVGLAALASPNWRFLATRSTILFVSYLAYYLAIPALPIAAAAALFFMAPLLIMTMAGPYLGERVPWQSLAAGAVGLVGVIVMVNPGAGIFEWAALLSLASAWLYSFSQLMARKIGVVESATTMAFYQNAAYLIGGVAISAIFAVTGLQGNGHPSLDFLMRPWLWPTLRDLMMMGACGVIAAVGMVLLGQAYRLAPANKAATFEYSGLLWAPLWGFLFFAEIPGTGTLVGALLIVGAGIFALNVGGKASQAAPANATD